MLSQKQKKSVVLTTVRVSGTILTLNKILAVKQNHP